jgi:hypothetical protein
MDIFKQENTLTKECCICKGISTYNTTSSAYLVIEGKEYRVHYHTACLSEETKKVIVDILNTMSKEV